MEAYNNNEIIAVANPNNPDHILHCEYTVILDVGVELSDLRVWGDKGCNVNDKFYVH